MNGKRTPMSTKEIRRAQLLESVTNGERSLYRMFQVMRSHPPTVVRPGTRVEVHIWLDGSLHVVTTGGRRLRVEEITHEQRTSKESALSA